MVDCSYNEMKLTKVRELITKLEEYYGVKLDFLKKYHFYMNNKEKVHISKINLNELNLKRINTIGLYFGVYHNEDRFRLSVEGSKLIKPQKNFLELNEKSLNTYLHGENLFTEEIEKINHQNNCPFLIVTYNGDNMGCMNLKDNIYLTYLSKSRKLDFNKLF